MSYVKNLSNITRDEWIVYYWISVASIENVDAYIQGVPRDPSESVKAGEEWDEWRRAYDVLHGKV